MIRILIHPTADKELARIPEEARRAIVETIRELIPLNHPLQHHRVVKLRGRKTKDFRLRVGDYRIEFTFADTIAHVTRIEQRQAGY